MQIVPVAGRTARWQRHLAASDRADAQHGSARVSAGGLQPSQRGLLDQGQAVVLVGLFRVVVRTVAPLREPALGADRDPLDEVLDVVLVRGGLAKQGTAVAGADVDAVEVEDVEVRVERQ